MSVGLRICIQIAFEKARKYKILYNTLSLPCFLIPVVLSSISETLILYPVVNTVLLVILAFLNAISSFFNFGKTSARHYEYQNRYSELSDEINTEMAKRKKYRISVDVFMERIKLCVANLNRTAPNL